MKERTLMTSTPKTEASWNAVGREVRFTIQRFDPAKDRKPHPAEYNVLVIKGMTVLDALFYIKEQLDPTLSFRCSCRMGICGSCGMSINGVPRLACQTQVFELGREEVKVGPLPNYTLIKDLATDFAQFFKHHQNIHPYILRPDLEELEKPSREYLQTPTQLESYLQFSFCIKCGLCNAACPIGATDLHFTGPQALGQAYRYMADNRDDGFEARTRALDRPHGVWRCHFAGACSTVCPKGVDPALAAQLIKKRLLAPKFRGRGGRPPARVAPPRVGVKPKADAPKPPPPSV